MVKTLYSYKPIYYCDGAWHTAPEEWDLVIAHPPCTYLTVSGNRYFAEDRYGAKAYGRYMSVAVDLANKDKHDPAIWPEWSAETKMWWDEIEQRMTRPACLDFDWESAKTEIREEVDKQNDFLKGSKDYQTSWRVGVVDGLWKAYNIMETHVKRKPI